MRDSRIFYKRSGDHLSAKRWRGTLTTSALLVTPPIPSQVASECQNWRVAVKRIKPNIRSYRFDESRDFYTGVFGLVESEGLDWILFFGTDQREVQLSVMKMDVAANVHPDVSIEVDNLDAVYQRAREAGAEIVYPLTEEEWGLRRFFVRDPNGAVLNVTEHR